MSDSLHAQSDDECLKLATSVRIVLAKLAEKISEALKDEEEIKAAVGALTNRKQIREKTLEKDKDTTA